MGQTLYKRDNRDNELFLVGLSWKIGEEIGDWRWDVPEGFGCKLASIETCTGARGWNRWCRRSKGGENGPSRGRGGGEPRGGNGWACARDDSGWRGRRHVDVLQEGGEAGTGVDTGCGETRAAEEEPVVENWFLFDQLANGDEGTTQKERVGQIGRVGKERIRVC
jgi:hypothetical protein